MKKQLLVTLILLGLGTACLTPALAEDLSSFAGKWTAKKTNENGEKYNQEIEIKKDKFTFKVTSPDGESRLYAEGDVKIDKAGPFKTMIFSNIKAGQSSSDTTALDDTYTSIYKLGDDDTLMVVMNFDKERDEQQKPRLDVYHKVKQAQK
jgi:uncharacterized protein (TIGR03067 family)